jgi:hypothetical protein
MKRYVCAWGETAYKPVYLASEVDTERAKDKEELRKNKVTISTQSVFLNMKDKEIARLRKAVQEIEYLADRITIENESIARAILKLAREALEGE